MIDCPAHVSESVIRRSHPDILLLSENGSEATDLGSESGSHVLGSIRY